MRRRAFITLLGGAAAAPSILLPRAARAQRMRRVGILIFGAADDPNSRANAAAIRDSLSKLGWIEGRNLRIDLRFTRGDLDAIRADAEQLVSLAPDVIVAFTGPVTRAVQLTTRTIPIVLVSVGDPVANGYVTNLARPEGNTTGFTNLFFSIAGKWVELLKDAAPHLERVAFVYNSAFSLTGYWGEIETAGSKLAVRTARIPVGTASEIERNVEALAAESNGALILGIQPNDALRELVSRLAIRYRLPTIYNEKSSMPADGLMSYGPSRDEVFGRGAPFYVDRLLRGTKVSELPVQFPTKFELVVNLKTAKAIGLTIPEAFLLRADELIE